MGFAFCQGQSIETADVNFNFIFAIEMEYTYVLYANKYPLQCNTLYLCYFSGAATY